MQSATHSTCCSIDASMLLSTEGLPGPVIMKRFGKPLRLRRPDRSAGRPPTSRASATPSRPRMSSASSAPVIASKPVAKTIIVELVLAGRGADAARA